MSLSIDSLVSETPPRAWGRLLYFKPGADRARNTPTSVGKTSYGIVCCGALEKHPHERGEDRKFSHALLLGLETPPRAWGRLAAALALPSALGNTPTSVGKTANTPRAPRWSWKHPHERGEDPVAVA